MTDADLGSIAVSVSIYSNALTPDEIDGLIGVSADARYDKGRRYGRAEREWQRNEWLIRETREVDFERSAGDAELSSCLAALMARLHGKIEAVRAAADDVLVRVAILSPYQPALIFKPQHLSAMAELGAGMDIDVMLFGDDDEG